MIAKPRHNRKLGVLEVSLTKARLRPEWGTALDWVRDSIEKVMSDSGYLEGAAFTWVTIAVRYGMKNDQEPQYQKVNNKYGDLPLSIEVDTRELVDAPLDETKILLGRAVLKALIHAGRKFERPVKSLEEKLDILSNGINGLDDGS